MSLYGTHFTSIKKQFNTPNLKFKDFRDILIKNLIKLPKKMTANELFVLQKYPSKPPVTNHYQEKIPLPEYYK